MHQTNLPSLPVQPEGQEERQAFEAWAQSVNANRLTDPVLAWMFEAWQARAALSSSTTPAPSPSLEDVRDAARYRWLRTAGRDHQRFTWSVEKRDPMFGEKEELYGWKLDAAIDAAISAQQKEQQA